MISLLDAAINNLGQCDWPEHDCQEPATIHHIGAENEFCERHYNQFVKDYGWQFPNKFDRMRELEEAIDREITMLTGIVERAMA